MLGQIMEDEIEHKEDMGKNGRTVGVGRPTYDECRAINVILEPLELPDRGDESLHRVLNSPTGSESSSGSWSPIRRLRDHRGAPGCGARGATRWSRSATGGGGRPAPRK